MTKAQQKQSGLIKLFIIFVALLLILSALKINLYGNKESSAEGALQTNQSLVVRVGQVIWFDYIVRPTQHVWGTYVVPFMRGEFLHGLKKNQEEHSNLTDE